MAAGLAGLILLMLFLGVIGARPAIAASRAGTSIVNRAQLHGRLAGQVQNVESNFVSNRIDEVLDVALRHEAASPPQVESHTEAQPVAFLLRNDGNGIEAFLVSIEASGGSAQVRSLAVDSNNDGRFDPAIDTIIGSNDPTPPLQPGATLRLIALIDAAEEGQTDLTIHARSITGTGIAGTLFAGRGDENGDALTGPTHAEASVTLALAIAGDPISLVKSQQILADDGSSRPVRGATIKYVIEARLLPGANIADARIVDEVPTGTSYVPGSLTLDGARLSEAPDDDPGLFRNNEIEVALGSFTAAPVRTVAFDVKIN